MTFKLVESRVDLSVVKRFGALADGLEEQWLWVKLGVNAEDIKNNTGRCAVITTSNDVSVANDKNQFPLVIIVERRERVDCTPERVLAFGVTWYLAEYEFILHFRLTLASKLQRSQN